MAHSNKKFSWVVCLLIIVGFKAFAQKPEVYFHQNFFKQSSDKVLVESTLFVKDANWRKLTDAEAYVGVQVLNSEKQVIQQDQRIIKANTLLPLTLENTFLPYRLASELKAGNYTLKLLVKTKKNNDSLLEIMPFVVKAYHPDTAALSSIQMLLRYDRSTTNTIWTKHNYDLELQPSFIASKTNKFLHAFIEAYQGKQHKAFLVRLGISKGNSGLWLDYTTNRKIKPEETDIVLLKSIDISDLPSGNYFLRADLLDTAGNLINTQRIEFTRINPAADKVEQASLNTRPKIAGTFVDSMPLADVKKYLAALQPIATTQEQNTIGVLVKTQNTKQMQDYLLEFWKRRNATDPEDAFNDYKELLSYAQQNYAVPSINVFNTDRGRVLLQYGKPNRLDNELTDPARVGIQNSNLINYEIWTYYHTQRSNQNNVQFVFVQENQGNSNYRLIHSTAIGEIYAPNWRNQMQQRYTQGNNGFNIDR